MIYLIIIQWRLKQIESGGRGKLINKVDKQKKGVLVWLYISDKKKVCGGEAKPTLASPIPHPFRRLYQMSHVPQIGLFNHSRTSTLTILLSYLKQLSRSIHSPLSQPHPTLPPPTAGTRLWISLVCKIAIQ